MFPGIRRASPDRSRGSGLGSLLPSLGTTAGASAMVFLVLLADALWHPYAFFDVWTTRTVQQADAPGLGTGLGLVDDLTSSTGAVGMWGLTLIALVALGWWLPGFAASSLLIACGISYALSEYLVGRTRPNLPELTRVARNADERSFPSGHVLGAVMLYGLLFVVARRCRPPALRLAAQGICLVIIAGVCVARVWRGAHWPTDVIGAYALGLLLLSGLLAAANWVESAIEMIDDGADRDIRGRAHPAVVPLLTALAAALGGRWCQGAPRGPGESLHPPRQGSIADPALVVGQAGHPDRSLVEGTS